MEKRTKKDKGQTTGEENRSPQITCHTAASWVPSLLYKQAPNQRLLSLTQQITNSMLLKIFTKKSV